ncbi:MAG TPA: hypothetical protein QGG93_09145 [Verrucomicrobiota bacterium]|nr:hypothetical protein [Verrucomicrobiota bacterium]
MKNILASLAIIGFCLSGIANIYTAIKYFEFIERDTFHIVEHIVLNGIWFSGHLAGVFVAISCLLAAKKPKTTPPPVQPPITGK